MDKGTQNDKCANDTNSQNINNKWTIQGHNILTTKDSTRTIYGQYMDMENTMTRKIHGQYMDTIY